MITYNGKFVTYNGKFVNTVVTQSWQQQSQPISTGYLNDVVFTDANTGWACGQDWNFSSPLVLKTVNGTSWSSLTLPVLGSTADLNGISVVGQNCWTVGITNDSSSLIFHTSNDGVSWNQQTVDSSSVFDLKSVCFVDTSNGWACGLDENIFHAILHTTNGGTTWTRQTSPTVASGRLYSICFVDSSNGWALGDIDGTDTVQMLHTSNAGTTWTLQTMPGGFISNAAPEDVFFIDASHGWACGRASGAKKIIYTSDGGANWAQQTLPVDSAYSLFGIHFSDINNGISVGNNVSGTQVIVYTTTDGGTTWNEENVTSVTGWLLAGSIVNSSNMWAVGYDNVGYAPIIIKK
jgi:photosystem II stability/assembly factor-like uncharacterized protein